mmetsp:Transcript_44128/g.86575  ORF Transcript_44128/g.86575 Transcript_44128/m.86575 type:complete len:118 (-) Transcript_44128:471-824(-)
MLKVSLMTELSGNINRSHTVKTLTSTMAKITVRNTVLVTSIGTDVPHQFSFIRVIICAINICGQNIVLQKTAVQHPYLQQSQNLSFHCPIVALLGRSTNLLREKGARTAPPPAFIPS